MPNATAACANCASPLTGPFCSACGQRARDGRFTVRTTVARLIADAFDVNRGVLFTVIELTRSPGTAIREYVSGRVVRYTNPVKYFLFATALTVLVYVQTGAAAEVNAEVLRGTHDAGSRQAAIDAGLAQALSVLTAYMNVAMAAAIPLTAFATRFFFRRAGFNLAEHLVFNLFTYAHSALFFAAGMLIGRAAGLSNEVVTLGYGAASTAYFAWAAVVFFGTGAVSGTIRAIASAVLSYLVYLAIFMAAISGYLIITVPR